MGLASLFLRHAEEELSEQGKNEMNADHGLRRRAHPDSLGPLREPDRVRAGRPLRIALPAAPDIRVPLTETTIDLERLAAPLEEVVREAGAIALGYFRGGARAWTKGDDSPVTEADLAVDSFLKERLPPLVEGSGWLSEETADTAERLDRRHVWIVDPIDGTRAFTENKTDWVVSVALVEDGAPIAGVVRNACDDVTYLGLKGLGATRNRETLAAPDSDSLDGVKVGGQKSLVGHLKPLGAVSGPWIYALAHRLVQVSSGGLDAAVARPNAHDWDIAAAHIILNEAGASLIGFDGVAPSYNRASTRHGGLIAAGPKRALSIASAINAGEAASALETRE